MPVFPSTDGVQVAAYDFGGDGPPLLLAHATGFHAHVLEPLARELGAHLHCYAFDERGHGDTVVPDGLTYAWGGFADDARAVIAGFGLARPFGFGHSAGGAALLLAEEDDPGLFRALYCFEPIVLPYEVPLDAAIDNPLSEGARRRREVFPSRDDAYANYASKPPLDVLAPDVLRAYVDHGFAALDDGTVRLKCRGAVEAEVYRMMPAHNAFARFGLVRCPVEIACGEQSDAFGPGLIARQAAALADARTEVFPGLGHFGPLQDPPAVAQAVARAFRVHPGRHTPAVP